MKPNTYPKPKNLLRNTPLHKPTEFDPASALHSEDVMTENLDLALASRDTDLLLTDRNQARDEVELGLCLEDGLMRSCRCSELPEELV